MYVTSSLATELAFPGANNLALTQDISSVTSPENSSPLAFTYSVDVQLFVYESREKDAFADHQSRLYGHVSPALQTFIHADLRHVYNRKYHSRDR